MYESTAMVVHTASSFNFPSLPLYHIRFGGCLTLPATVVGAKVLLLIAGDLGWIWSANNQSPVRHVRDFGIKV